MNKNYYDGKSCDAIFVIDKTQSFDMSDSNKSDKFSGDI